jgi:hypothetical protein
MPPNYIIKFADNITVVGLSENGSLQGGEGPGGVVPGK